MEFRDNEMKIFNELMEVVKKYPDFNSYDVKLESALQLPGLEIYPDRRKIYRNQREVSLTAKEFDILSLLAANPGRVITYAQIYEQVWASMGKTLRTIR